MLPASLRHPSVILCAIACVLATGMLTAHAFLPHSALSAFPWLTAKAGPSDHFLTDPLPAPTLALLDADGKPVTLETLKGRVWLCDFFLTRCTSICPALTRRFSDFDRDFSADPKYADIGLLSIAVDPAHDTPAVLNDYTKKKLGLGPRSRWVHATGADQAAVREMIRRDFKLFVDDTAGDPTTPVAHSDKIILLDTRGRIRGYYGGRDEAEMGMLKNDLDYLLAHPQ